MSHDTLPFNADPSFGEGASTDDTERLLVDLAQLGPMAYDLRREAEADNLGIRVTSLDKEIALRRPRPESDAGQGRALDLFEPEPWRDTVNGAELLDAITAALGRFLVLPEHSDTAIALWTLHAHAHNAADIAPRLAFTSPLPRCGKTTALSIVGRLVPRALPASNITTAAVFRVIEAAKPTLLVDEADTFLRDSDELRGVLNCGHSRENANVVRVVGDTNEPKSFSTWAPIAIAIIGRLPATLEDRSIVVPMKRKTTGERIERFRRNRLDEIADLASMTARWAADNLSTLTGREPDQPNGLHDRAADNWEPLFSIADLAGGDWPKRAREAALALSGGGEEDSYGALVLADIREIFQSKEVDRLPSETICNELAGLEDRPWGEYRREKPISTRQLARLLKPFNINSGTKRQGEDTFKGYLLSDFQDAFIRYQPPNLSVTAAQPAENLDFSRNLSVTNAPNVTDRDEQNPKDSAACGAVTDRNGGMPHEGVVVGDSAPEDDGVMEWTG